MYSDEARRDVRIQAQVDAITQNEHLDPDSLIMSANPSPLKDLQHLASLSVLNLAYDVTPANLVTMLITEVGCIPATSVPAVTREFMKSM